MGVWGTALYSGDFATDLRATIGALARLPFDPDRLVEILCSTESTTANNPNSEEYTTFWLIVADQFAKRGMVSDRVREAALEIIDGEKDITMLQRLGMNESDLRRRRQILQGVRMRITQANVGKPRSVLKKPQPLLMEVGDVIVYPTRHGGPINPYFATKPMVDGQPWMPDGWAAAVIVDCGRAFEFLSWYRPLTMAEAKSEKPVLDSLRTEICWKLELPGTCSATHFKRMELEKLGSVVIDPEKIEKLFPGLRPGISAAVNDISLANRFHASPQGRRPTAADARAGVVFRSGALRYIWGIEQILRLG